MMKFFLRVGSIILVAFYSAQLAYAQNQEVSLFDSQGKPVAYIAIDDELTIYLWDGSPVAYVQPENQYTHIYGFNGKHLGWFTKSTIINEEGHVACATKEALSITKLEPLKSLKSLKPLKSLPRLAPLKPLSTSRFGSLPCNFHLSMGAK